MNYGEDRDDFRYLATAVMFVREFSGGPRLLEVAGRPKTRGRT